jgi:hypothetical protein
MTNPEGTEGGVELLPCPEIMYVCDCCADSNPEMCGQYKREDIRFLASGNLWLCRPCFEEESEDDWGAARPAPKLEPARGRDCFAGKAFGDGDPQDCGWPFCDCDPATVKVLAGLQECGYELARPADHDTVSRAEVLAAIAVYRDAASKELADNLDGPDILTLSGLELAASDLYKKIEALPPAAPAGEVEKLRALLWRALAYTEISARGPLATQLCDEIRTALGDKTP